MSINTEVKKALKEAGLPNFSKLVNSKNLTAISLASLIDQYELSSISGLTKEELLDDTEYTWTTFKENVLNPLDNDAVTFEIEEDYTAFSLTDLKRSLSKVILQRNDLFPKLDFVPYVDVDSYLSHYVQDNKIAILAIHKDKHIKVVLYFKHLSLPVLGQLKQLKQLADKENPSEEDEKQYAELYKEIKKHYKDNQEYYIKREEIEQQRVLFSKEAREFVNLATILRLNF